MFVFIDLMNKCKGMDVEPIFNTDIIKVSGENRYQVKDTLIREVKIEIVVNNKKVGALMATPMDQKELVIGFLKAENIIDRISDIQSLTLLEDGTKVDVIADVNEEKINSLNSEGVVISGCGKGLSANIDPEKIEAKIIKSDFAITSNELFSFMKEFYTQCPLYEKTGCVHTAKLYIDKDRHYIGEDIAQHNTIDKAVGKAILDNASLDRSILMVSGRLSSEMVAKAVMHGIPILASRTASTCLGFKIAEKFGLTLLGFVRGKSMNIYANPQRIL